MIICVPPWLLSACKSIIFHNTCPQTKTGFRYCTAEAVIMFFSSVILSEGLKKGRKYQKNFSTLKQFLTMCYFCWPIVLSLSARLCAFFIFSGLWLSLRGVCSLEVTERLYCFHVDSLQTQNSRF